VAVIDPHANISEAVVDSVDGLIAYRTNPHVDMSERGAEAAALLGRILSGACRPYVAATRVPVIAPAIAQATGDEPLASLLARARALERRNGVLSVSITFGFAYADVPEVAMAAIVVSDGDQALAEELARELGRSAWEARDAFERGLVAPEEAVAIAAASQGVTMLVDTGDNVGGGAPGDSTVIARAVLDHGALCAVTTVCDPGAVAAAVAAGTGAKLDVVLGDPPLRVAAHVRALPSGRFVNDGPLSRGVEFDMGKVAVLDAAQLTIVAQSRAVMANDQNMLRSVGVDASGYHAVILKGAAAVRAGWAGAAARFVDVATPGPTTSDLSTLPYRNVGRLWPLERFSWHPGEAGGG
jgi:microcystin degradation protein MlrC